MRCLVKLLLLLLLLLLFASSPAAHTRITRISVSRSRQQSSSLQLAHSEPCMASLLSRSGSLVRWWY